MRVIVNISIRVALRLDAIPVEVDWGIIKLAGAATFRFRCEGCLVRSIDWRGEKEW